MNNTETSVNNNIENSQKSRKPKDINFVDKKTFRLGQIELDNLAKGSRVFEEQQSDYIRRLLQINPVKVKALLNAIEDMEDKEESTDYEELEDPGFCELLEGSEDLNA